MIVIIEEETSLVSPILNVDVTNFDSTSVAVKYTIGYSSSVHDYVGTQKFESHLIESVESFQGLSNMFYRSTFSNLFSYCNVIVL